MKPPAFFLPHMRGEERSGDGHETRSMPACLRAEALRRRQALRRAGTNKFFYKIIGYHRDKVSVNLI